jgi:serine/threonine protein kinase
LPRFPKSGENFEEFQLLSRLGKGGTSRVFLARDLSLGGKHVALKVTLARGQEPKIQGPLEHPHIVPVNSVTYHSDGRLCGLSMPYQPGLPLDEIIKRVKPSRRPSRALALWSVLVDAPNRINPCSEQIPTVGVNDFPRGDGWKGFPERGSYAHGVAWIVKVLARALHYAHGRSIYHRDVKPANVLLTINHGPQLLDFNLAESPDSADNARAALHGGTPPYMAPEQIEAFLNPELWPRVGVAADIYSLGLVLRELLTGQMPDLPKPGLPAPRAMNDLLSRRHFLDVAVRRSNPAISPSLEAIVTKCLAFSPADRYDDAESLAEDLERFLNHQPLLKAGNPSQRERVGNYWKRHRRTFKRSGLVAALVLAFAAALASPIMESLAPSVQSQPGFLALVNSIETAEGKGSAVDGQAEVAAKALERIASAFPRSCLVKFYLAFVSKNDPGKSDESLRQALVMPDVARTVPPWAEHHPEFCPLLVDWADDRIMRADVFAQKNDSDGSTTDDRERDTELRRSGYELAQHALLLAQKLDATSNRIQRLLATTEQLFGAYVESHRRLTHLVNTLPRETDPEMSDLFFCRKLRGRVAFLSVEKQMSLGNRPDTGTVKFLEDARADLMWCAQYLDRYGIADHQIKEFAVNHDLIRATLDLAKVELALEPAKSIEKRLRYCQSHIEVLETLRNSGVKVPIPTILKIELERLRSSSKIASSQ